MEAGKERLHRDTTRYATKTEVAELKRLCTRGIRAEVKAGFFDEPRSTGAVKERLTEKGVSCSSGLLRTSLKKVVDEWRLSPTASGRARVYSRTGERSVALPPAESSEAAYRPYPLQVRPGPDS